MNGGGDRTPLNSPLIEYALKGLERCWLPEHGRWSHIYHLDGRKDPNESLPQSDVFYTLNVLLGFSRLRQMPANIDVPGTFEKNALQLLKLPVARYSFGMALWTAAELNLEVPQEISQHIKSLLNDKKNWWNLRAQDLGMLLTGIIAQAKIGQKQLLQYAEPLFLFLENRYLSQSGLFFDAASGFRRRFASFATQTYLTLACYTFGDFCKNSRALDIANACTDKLLRLQGPAGEWPWFYDAKSGRVVDPYEVYSVHQYGMAPAFLELAEHHRVPGARDGLIKGFNWIFGDNQLATPMLVPELNLTIRSQVRKGELTTNKLRMLRAIKNAYLRRTAGLIDPADVRLRLECRSYELGWILWSFGQRSDLPELTHRQEFIDALK
jgi:hypothetical protein